MMILFVKPYFFTFYEFFINARYSEVPVTSQWQ